MGRFKRLGINTMLIFIGNIGSKIIGIIMLPFYTSWLSVEDYGLTDIITVYVSLLFSLVTCCIGESLFIFPKDVERKEQSKYLTSAVTFSSMMLIATGILFIFINFISAKNGILNSFTSNIILIYFLLVSQVFQQLFQQFTRSINKIKVYSITGIIVTICTALLAFILIPQYGVYGYVWSIIGANLIGSIYSICGSKTYTYFRINHFNSEHLKRMLKYSIPLIPNGVMWWLVGALNRPIMEQYLGFHEIGIFAVANKFPSILSMLFTIFATSWQISVIEEFGKKDYASFYNNVFKFIFIILCVLLIVISLSSKLLITLFTTKEFFEAWKYVPLLTLGVLFSNISAFVGTNFSAVRNSKYYFYSSIWGAITAIVMNFLLIPIIGIWGTVLSTIFSFLAMALSRIIYSWKYVKIKNALSYFIYLMISSSIILCYVTSSSNIIIYIMLTILLTTIWKCEKQTLTTIKNKYKHKLPLRNK